MVALYTLSMYINHLTRFSGYEKAIKASLQYGSTYFLWLILF